MFIPATTGATSVQQARTITIAVERKSVVGGVREVKLKRGEDVRLVVSSDAVDEIHVHGYDLTQKVAPGSVATLQFKVDKPGAFEVELEDEGLKLAELQITG